MPKYPGGRIENGLPYDIIREIRNMQADIQFLKLRLLTTTIGGVTGGSLGLVQQSVVTDSGAGPQPVPGGTN
jgi:hypothetical protein